MKAIPEEIYRMILDRSNELLKEDSVKQKYNTFKKEKDAKSYLIRLAIATLYGKM